MEPNLSHTEIVLTKPLTFLSVFPTEKTDVSGIIIILPPFEFPSMIRENSWQNRYNLVNMQKGKNVNNGLSEQWAVGIFNILKKKAYDLIYVHKKSPYVHTVKF